MAGKNGRTPDDAANDDRFEVADNGIDDEDDDAANDADDDDYSAMMLLDQLESLEEEMLELGVTTLDEVRARIREMHAQMGD